METPAYGNSCVWWIMYGRVKLIVEADYMVGAHKHPHCHGADCPFSKMVLMDGHNPPSVASVEGVSGDHGRRV